MYFKLCLITVCFLIQQVVSEDKWLCKTPEGEPGECITLVACPPLMKAFANPQKEIVQNLTKYICSDKLSHVVCCGLSSNFTVPKQNVQQKPAVSDFQICGKESRKNNPTNQQNLPWLAQVTAYDDEDVALGTPGYGAGVLINKRYVLTYIPALVGYTNLTEAFGVTVRLGNLEQPKRDNATDGSTPYEEFGVEVAITHPFYSYSAGLNALTLLRLDREVTFSDCIRPICLPTPGTTMPTIGDNLFLYGWQQWGPLIKTTTATIVPNEECTKFWKGKSNKPITTYNRCTSGGFTNYTKLPCPDPGTPAMFYCGCRWYLGSIVNWVVPEDVCKDDVRYVLTEVSEYLDWIHENAQT